MSSRIARRRERMEGARREETWPSGLKVMMIRLDGGEYVSAQPLEVDVLPCRTRAV